MVRRIILFYGLIAVAFVLQGCMASMPFQPAHIQPDKALLYIYRPESIISRGTHFSVVVNDKEEIGPLVNNGYITVYVNPGSVKLVLQENTIPKGILHNVTFDNLETGGGYYIKANPAVFGAYKLVKMDEAIGKAEVSKTMYYQVGK